MKKVYRVNPITGRTQVSTVNDSPSQTQQQFAGECDYNNIMKRYIQTGQITHLNRNRENGAYRDLSTSHQFQDAMNIITEANSAFNSLPSPLRSRFLNDPARMLEFLEDPANYNEAVKLGLCEARPDTNERKKNDDLTTNKNSSNTNSKSASQSQADPSASKSSTPPKEE